MNVEAVIDLGYQTLATAFWVALPILAAGMAIGLIVAVLTAATQIQEASLNFVPKLAAIGFALVVFGSWIIEKISGFTIQMIGSISTIGGGP